LKVYYGDSGKDKNHVRADRMRAYQRYDMISIQLDKIKIVPESTEAATVTFDKGWTMKNAQKTSTGSVLQELHMVKINGKWLIDAERDVKTYFINNRENEADANANVPENSSTNASKNVNQDSVNK
jgi:Tol biopolymer transport system component